jgi:hypothetical protein
MRLRLVNEKPGTPEARAEALTQLRRFAIASAAVGLSVLGIAYINGAIPEGPLYKTSAWNTSSRIALIDAERTYEKDPLKSFTMFHKIAERALRLGYSIDARRINWRTEDLMCSYAKERYEIALRNDSYDDYVLALDAYAIADNFPRHYTNNSCFGSASKREEITSIIYTKELEE